ncbi:tail protein [Escherichia phage vB-EcoP-XT18]|uniref:Tail protein n=1 Tax=Escherichia phage vB-EcoP-XT18 TaxID=3093889 RepID=A0ABZ0S421_9CAUD|nr:tail protein [Escherichia phage vB-EcoP-XT18]
MVQEPVPISKGGTGAINTTIARSNLGLGDVSVENIVPISKGGTGAINTTIARSNLGLGDVSVENIVPISKGGTGASSPDTARLALVAAKSGANSDITSMTNKVTFSQPIRIPNAVESDEAVALGQVSNVVSQELGLPTGFNLIGDLPSIEQLQTLEGASVGDKVFVRSYVEGANMGGGVFVAIDNSETADGVVVFSGVSVKWKRLLFSGEASVFDAGYTGSGDIAVYINKVNSSGYDCIVPTSGSVLSEIAIDVSKGALIGYNNCKLQEGAGATGQYFLKIINSNTDYGLRDSISSTAKISGVSFVGLGARKVVIGGTDSGEVSEVRIENCGFISTAGLEFLDNSYRILFDKCAISRSFTDTVVFKSRANSGEVIKFNHCWCVDNGGPFTFENGQFIFDTCSLPAGKKSGYFDPTIIMTDNATVVFSNGNIEYQPDQSFVSFSVNGSSRLSIKDSTILVPVGFSSVPIVSNGDGFVSLTNCSLPLYGNNTLATGFPTRQLIGGDSKRVVSNGCYPRAGFVLSRWDLGSIVSPYINSLSNGSGQFLNTSNWTFSQTGSGVVSVSQPNDVPSSSPMFNTSFSFGVPDTTSSANFTQSVSECHPGRYFQFGFWAKNTTTTLASIRFLDSAGNAVSESIGYYIPSNNSFSFYAVIDSVPPGSSKAEINFNIGGAVGGCVLHNIIYGLI